MGYIGPENCKVGTYAYTAEIGNIQMNDMNILMWIRSNHFMQFHGSLYIPYEGKHRIPWIRARLTHEV